MSPSATSTTSTAAPPRLMRGHAQLGLWTSRVAALCAIGFGVGAVVDRIPAIPDPWGPVAAYLPSLLLALVLPIALVAVHHAVPPPQRVWTHAALTLATMYAVLATLTYVTQLLVVEPHRSAGELADVSILEFTDKSLFMVVDTTAYCLLGLALLMIAPAVGAGVVGSPRTERRLKRVAIANGVLAPVYLAAVWVPPLIVVGVLWLVAVPAQMLLTGQLFTTEVRSQR